MKIQQKTIQIGEVGIFSVDLPLTTVGTGSPKVLVVANQHGGEYSGLFVIKELVSMLKAKPVSGQFIFLGSPNPFGQIMATRNEPLDGADLNRMYPGNPKKNFPGRLAHAIFNLANSCDAVVDLHTFSRQTAIIGVLTVGTKAEAQSRSLLRAFGPDAVWKIDVSRTDDAPFTGCLDTALGKIGIPAIGVEMPRFEWITPKEVKRMAAGIIRLQAALGSGKTSFSSAIPTYAVTSIFSDKAGIFTPLRTPLTQIRKGEILGTITSLRDYTHTRVTAPLAGTLITLRGHDVLRTGSKLGSIGTDQEKL